jgi:hypothetical protein
MRHKPTLLLAKNLEKQMTQDDRMSLFCGKLADAKDQLGLTAFEYSFAEDNRFTFNFSPRMKRVVIGLMNKYAKKIGWKDD